MQKWGSPARPQASSPRLGRTGALRTDDHWIVSRLLSANSPEEPIWTNILPLSPTATSRKICPRRPRGRAEQGFRDRRDGSRDGSRDGCGWEDAVLNRDVRVDHRGVVVDV